MTLKHPTMAPVAIERSQPLLSDSDTSLKVTKEGPKTLPAQWNRDEGIFQLEKRAIFSKVRIKEDGYKSTTSENHDLKIVLVTYSTHFALHKAG